MRIVALYVPIVCYSKRPRSLVLRQRPRLEDRDQYRWPEDQDQDQYLKPQNQDFEKSKIILRFPSLTIKLSSPTTRIHDSFILFKRNKSRMQTAENSEFFLTKVIHAKCYPPCLLHFTKAICPESSDQGASCGPHKNSAMWKICSSLGLKALKSHVHTIALEAPNVNLQIVHCTKYSFGFWNKFWQCLHILWYT